MLTGRGFKKINQFDPAVWPIIANIYIFMS